MGRTCAGFVERTVRASFDKVGVLCLIAPFATSIILFSLSCLGELYSVYLHIQKPFMPTPACILLLCILILVAITIMSHPSKESGVPSHVLHLPFNPIQVATFSSSAQSIEENPVTRMARSSSHPCLSHTHAAPLKATTLPRSPSHETFLTGKPLHHRSKLALLPTENLSDEEINRRFSAFIESRFAAMKREMVE